MNTSPKTSSIQERTARISVSASSTIRQTMQTINQGALGLAVLVEPKGGRFVGLVTDGDIRRALLSGLGLETQVDQVSRPQPITAPANATAEQLASMFNEKIRVIPLLNEAGQAVDLAILDRRTHLPVAAPALTEKELLYVTECILTGWISSAGKFVTRFEEMFAAFCDTKHAIATSNGTTALHLALLAIGIGPGDEVIVPTLTFIATANAVTYCGARAVFVDSETETWNLDPVAVEKAITPRTKAIIPVHLYGHPANMGPLLAIAQKHGLKVIEDAAEAHGARYQGKPVGGLGDMGIFSFYGNKIITTGEGGMLVTNDTAYAERARILRDHGMQPGRRYWHQVLGYNYRLTNLQAAVGVAQMESIEAILSDRRRMAAAYTRHLSGIPGLTTPPAAPWAANVCWLYSIVIDSKLFGCGRDELMTHLGKNDIESRPFFPCVHTQPIYATGQQLPVAEHLSANGVSLPSFPHISEDNIQRIAAAIRACGQQIHTS